MEVEDKAAWVLDLEKGTGSGLHCKKVPCRYSFEGEYFNDHRVNGLEIFENGSRYEGSFANGTYHGKGVYTTETGLVTEGVFVEGSIKSGVTTFPNGDVYKGSYEDSCFHGQGVLTKKCGSKYEGNFKKGLYDGHGVFERKPGEKYVGEFVEGAAWHGRADL